jgi:anthranilate phosphoribosyltransferase
MTVYLMRSITVDELKGFKEALLEICIPVKLNCDTIDVCGTGGDSKNTFNISTLSSFVIAGCGIKVAKHGNYGVSSVSGSSNVLEYFGYRFSNDVEVLQRQLDASNICFMHAPLFHPALKQVAPIRKELGIKTFFNMLGPLVNPALPKYRLVGVYNLELARIYNYLLQEENASYYVVHSLDGYDEISNTSAFKLYSEYGEELVDPGDLNIPICCEEDLFGGNTVQEAADIFLCILEGKGSMEQNNAVIVNSAYAIKCVTGKSIEDCMGIAKESLLSKKALATFNKLTEKQN